jgi:hypothetical protein
MQMFINLDSREQKEIKGDSFYRVDKLELIPKEWKIQDGTILLKGQ